jgi:ribosomal protein S12 methylthiotransferase accessory factor
MKREAATAELPPSFEVLHGSSDGITPGPPICAAAILRPRPGEDQSEVRIGFGKGLTIEQARAGAISEALELYAASRFSLAALIYSAMRDLPGTTLDPRRLSLYPERAYSRPDFPFARFDSARPIHWTRGTLLHTNEPVWMPALPTFLNFQPPRAERFCQATSNGLAAGGTLTDAMLHAIFELVERDAFMLTWFGHGRLPAERIILDEALPSGIGGVLERVTELGANVACYRLHAGIEIPVVLCVARGDGVNWPGATVGLGAHLSCRQALQQAILELGQTGPYLRRVMRGAEQPVPARTQVRTLRQHALFYLPRERARAFDFLHGSRRILLSEIGEPQEASLAEVSRRLSGVQVAIADLTPPDVAGIPMFVVRALGTDLQAIHCGTGLERTENARLKRLIPGPVNRNIHPLC